jgi:hypothetical protein
LAIRSIFNARVFCCIHPLAGNSRATPKATFVLRADQNTNVEFELRLGHDELVLILRAATPIELTVDETAVNAGLSPIIRTSKISTRASPDAKRRTGPCWSPPLVDDSTGVATRGLDYC